jgi:hypothetical protein
MIDAQPWDASVKALVHYPAVLTQMTTDAQWTASLGSAFTAEPAKVSTAIQDMRTRALAAGSLLNTPQMVIVQDAGVIAIQPAVESMVYVPVYNPLLAYTERVAVTFDAGLAVGPWLVHGYDWEGGTVVVGDWRGPYVYERGVWVRDHYWRSERFHSWRHDERFGPAPRLDRAQWSHSREIRGHEQDFRKGMDRTKPAGGERAINRSGPGGSGPSQPGHGGAGAPAHTGQSTSRATQSYAGQPGLKNSPAGLPDHQHRPEERGAAHEDKKEGKKK